LSLDRDCVSVAEAVFVSDSAKPIEQSVPAAADVRRAVKITSACPLELIVTVAAGPEVVKSV
jgi:uncharacterized Fe-S cluster protein YjdI